MNSFQATLHDDTTLSVSTYGSGPCVLLPVRTEPYDAKTAEQMIAWGAEPDLGSNLVKEISRNFRVVAADYEGHRMGHPAAETLTPQNLAQDLIAIADAAGADSFAYYGYSWLALSGLQLATRTDRLWGLAMGGFPPLGGPYGPMLKVTSAAHHKALEPKQTAQDYVEPGDWDAAGVQVDASELTKQVSDVILNSTTPTNLLLETS